MKFDAHVSNVGFILYLVAQVIPEPQRANQSFVPRFLFHLPNPNLIPCAAGQAYIPTMKAYLLLLPISFLPAVAGILVTRPIGCLVPLFLGDTGAVGCACILLSLFNLVIFQYYEQRLNISRCPQCHTRNLHVRKYSKGLYKLYCPHCGLHSRWRTWRYFSDEA